MDGGSNEQFIVDASGNVGIGKDTPTSKLNIESDVASLTDMVLIENTNSASAHARNLTLKNEGSNIIAFQNTSPGSGIPSEWNFQARHEDGSIYISNATYGGDEFELSKEGNLTISGDLIANGTTYASSVRLKENFEEIDHQAILNKLDKLNVSKWNYIKDGKKIKHIGPYAEEFHNTFNLNGENSKYISVSDVSGISLAAIKALIKKTEEQSIRISKLESHILTITK